MEKKTNELEVFQQFAEEELKNHLAELNTRYENEPLGSKELKQEAYEAHQKIYGQELSEKIQSLLSKENNGSLKEELENLKNTYVTKLNLKQQLTFFHSFN
jgi:hypothetical protein